MSPKPVTLNDIVMMIREFVEARDWVTFNKPSALALSAAIEMGEVLELFQWKTDMEIDEALSTEPYRSLLSEEIADVMIYLLRLADTANIDPTQAVVDKMKKNARKYPVSEFKGRRPNERST